MQVAAIRPPEPVRSAPPCGSWNLPAYDNGTSKSSTDLARYANGIPASVRTSEVDSRASIRRQVNGNRVADHRRASRQRPGEPQPLHGARFSRGWRKTDRVSLDGSPGGVGDGCSDGTHLGRAGP